MSVETTNRDAPASVRAWAAMIAACGLLFLGAAALAFVANSLWRRSPMPNYHLVQLGQVRADQFLLDRSSGRVWRMSCIGELSADRASCKGMDIWDEIFVTNLTSPTTNLGKRVISALMSQDAEPQHGFVDDLPK